MKPVISRTQFLRGDFRGAKKALRPPWATEEATFIQLCTACADCIRACPTGILTAGRAGFPVVDFSKGECDFCGACVEHCNTNALQRPVEPDKAPWTLKANIGERCITHQQVVCRSCAEQCETRAITFAMSAGQIPQPKLEEAICTGCGACVSVCPANAISVA